MPIWIPPTIADQPGLRLSGWAAFKVLIQRIGHPTVHLVGYNDDGLEGRVSSRLAAFDEQGRCGVTSSRRVYRLVGEPGLGAEASYVWERWVTIWGAEVLESVPIQTLEACVAASQQEQNSLG